MVSTVKKKFYVDKYLQSVPKENAAIKLAALKLQSLMRLDGKRGGGALGLQSGSVIAERSRERAEFQQSAPYLTHLVWCHRSRSGEGLSSNIYAG